MIAKMPQDTNAAKNLNWQELLPRPSAEFPRHYLPAEFDLTSWNSIEKVLEELIARPLPDAITYRQWIYDDNELNNALQEESSRLYIDMTCFTQDAEKEKAYLHFVENIEPKLSEASDKLNRRIADHPETQNLPEEEFGHWRRSIQVSLELFLEKNIPIHTEVTKLTQSYQKICSEMTVEWEGEIKTLSQMAPLLQSPDRSMREKVWRKITTRRAQDKEKLDTLFDELLVLRNQISANLGLTDYRAYAFKSNMREDYTPDDCKSFHAATEKFVVPLYQKLMDHRREKMGLETLQPWDLSVDIYGRAPLKPFENTAQMVEGVGRIFAKMDPELSEFYETMLKYKLMDLDNRVGKAPGGYQCSLNEMRLPFIFMNTVGLNEDIFTLLHESGHAFHLFYTRQMELGFNRHAPMEFSEVASMSMERLGAKYLQEFYSEADMRRAHQKELEEVIRLLPWVSIVDAFQHWIYTTSHTPAERQAYWLELSRRFEPQIDWSGLEEFRGYGWHKQLHIFELPFYYIEYGIAQLGALQVWHQSLKDEKKALENYKRGLKLGGTQGLRKLFESTGLSFEMGEATIKPLMEKVWEAWEHTNV